MKWLKFCLLIGLDLADTSVITILIILGICLGSLKCGLHDAIKTSLDIQISVSDMFNLSVGFIHLLAAARWQRKKKLTLPITARAFVILWPLLPALSYLKVSDSLSDSLLLLGINIYLPFLIALLALSTSGNFRKSIQSHYGAFSELSAIRDLPLLSWEFIWRFGLTSAYLQLYLSAIFVLLGSKSRPITDSLHVATTLDQSLKDAILFPILFVILIASWLVMRTLEDRVIETDSFAIPFWLTWPLGKGNSKSRIGGILKCWLPFIHRTVVLAVLFLFPFYGSLNRFAEIIIATSFGILSFPYLSFWSLSRDRSLFDDFLQRHSSHLKQSKSSNFEFQKIEGLDFSETDFKAANFGNAKLSDVRFIGSDLTKADFSNSILQNVDFSQANLTKANFNEAEMIECKLHHAKLCGVDFTTIKGVIAFDAFMGCNLIDAKLPESHNFEVLKTIEETSKAASNLHLIFVGAALYSWIAASTLNDADLLTGVQTLELPIVKSQIPIIGFFLLGPLVLLTVFVYFHLYLQKLWQQIASCPAIFQSGEPLTTKIYPWILSTPIELLFPNLKCYRSEAIHISVLVTIISAWLIAPFSCVIFWFTYLGRHEWLGTMLHITLISLSSFLSLASCQSAVNKLGEKKFQAFQKRPQIFNFLTYGLVQAVLFTVLSLVVHNGPPLPMNWLYADIGGVNLSTVPDGWDHKELDKVKGAKLSGISLHGAFCQYSMLVKADLRGCDLTFADLTGADLRSSTLNNANCNCAKFTKANLENTLLCGVSALSTDFSHGNLTNVNVSQARFRRANFTGATIENLLVADSSDPFTDTETSFGSCEFRNSNIQNCTIRNVSFNGSKFPKAKIRNVTFLRSDIGEANFERANIRNVSFENCDLTGTSFELADLEDVEFVKCSGVNLTGAARTEYVKEKR